MPFDQERRDYLNEKYPSAGHPRNYEQEFSQNTVDRQADSFLNEVRNRQSFYDNRQMVPSDAELRYRANLPQNPLTNPEPLSEGLLRRDRPNPTPPTDRPSSIPSAPRTSPASPPPTPRTSGGAGNVVDMQTPPPTAAPRQSLGGPNPAPNSKPSGLPGPPGRLGYPAAGAAIDFAFRLGAGQPLGQAAAGSAGSLVGGLVGAAAGSALGPVGGFVGGMVGGYLGGMAGSALYNFAFPPTAEAPQGLSDPKTGQLPFEGGQCCDAYHDVYGYRSFPGNPNEGQEDLIGKLLLGTISGIVKSLTAGGSSNLYQIRYVRCNGTVIHQDVLSVAASSSSSVKISRVVVVSGGNNCGNPPPLPIPKDNRTPDSLNHPGNTGFAPPSAAPPSAAPNANNNPAPNNYAPGGFQSKSGGTNRGDSPNWVPKGNLGPSPHPNTAPPPVSGLPSAAPSGSPASTGAPGPNATGNPNKSPFSFAPDGTLTIVSPGHPATTGNPTTNPADRSFPGLKPTTITPTVIQPTAIPHATLVPGNFSSSPTPDTGTPSGLPTTVTNQPTPDAYRQTPVVPAPTPTPTPTTPTNQPDFEDLKKRFDEQALLLVGLTALLNPIANNTTPEKLKDIVTTATCNNVQPGGCMSPLNENAANAANSAAANGNKLDVLNTALQGLDLSLLKVIDNKLGPQIKNGGLSGFLQRAYQATHIDKALNAMNTVLLVHNAAMLSRNLGSTLGDLTSQALSTIGIKDAEGSPIDINKEIGTQVNTFMENLVGAEVWRGTKTSWNKASSIISSATNIMYTVRSMFDSGREILEWTAENTGKIGNALKKYRIVGEDAYKWMPERITVQNAFTRRLDRIREGTDSLDDAASSLTGVLGEVQSIQQEYADLQEQKQRFDANIKDLTPKPREENKPIADAVTAARSASKAPADMPVVFRGEGENNDA